MDTSFVAPSIYQQWNWLNPTMDGMHQLQNRGNGLCLMTDNNSDRNAVWASECNSSKAGQFWENDLPSQIASHYWFDTLRVSPGSSAVYSSDNNDDYNHHGIPLETHYWNPSHN
ncbi:hypothetical protein [Streptomyces sp. NPDC058683]|uniref:hypothetical protein n=1 Tax=Streptomyces sp. NPDC058683 TaxID=3346597 RepID=UPI00364AF401